MQIGLIVYGDDRIARDTMIERMAVDGPPTGADAHPNDERGQRVAARRSGGELPAAVIIRSRSSRLRLVGPCRDGVERSHQRRQRCPRDGGIAPCVRVDAVAQTQSRVGQHALGKDRKSVV